jgi:uncharacterized membrane protein
MEPLLGCLAVVVFLFVVAGPLAALVLALRQRATIRDLAARTGRLQSQLEALERRPAREAEAPSRSAEPPVAAPAIDGSKAPAPPGAVLEAPEAPTPTSLAEPPAVAPAPAPAAPPPPRPAVPPAAPRPGLEERLGARLPVWLGGIALAAAGAFLVKYSVDQGWLSPLVRVVLGALFGVALLGLGEKLRLGSARVAQALSAAGVAVLYAVLLAAVRLYGLIPPLAGFGLLAANTGLAVALSLRQGPMVALLGLVGGFATPALIGRDTGDARGLLVYLLLLDVGLVAVTRRRGWTPLAGGALAASFLWVLVWLAGPHRAANAVPLGAFLLATSIAFSWRTFAAGARGTAAAEPGVPERILTALAAAGATALLAVVVGVASFGTVEWGMFALLAAGAYALATRRGELFALAPLAAAAAFALLAVWGYDLAPRDVRRFVATLALAGGGLALGAWGIGTRAARPARWATLFAVVWILFPLLGYLSVRNLLDLPWTGLAVALGAGATALAVPYAARRGASADGEAALAAVAVAAAVDAAFALPLALDRAALSVGFALAAPALLEVARRTRVDALRVLALGGAALAALRLLANPATLRDPLAATPVWNELLWRYGAPCAAFAAAAAIARRSRQEGTRAAFEAIAVAFGVALVAFQVWHLHGGGSLALLPDRWSILHWGSLAIAGLAFGIALIEAGDRRGREVLAVGGRLLVVAAALQVVLVHGLLRNPGWTPDAVGALPILDGIAWAFALPAGLLLVAAARVEGRGGRKLPLAARIAATLACFAWITLEVRHLFRGPLLAGGTPSSAEQFSYSASWALFGTVLLVLGIARRSRALRLAALAVMLAAVLKVFLVDTSELAGLYRVFSFLGLGAALLVLAHLYQRFVFRSATPR